MSYRDDSRRAFQSIGRQRSPLEPFETIQDLVDFMREPAHDKDRKDAILLELVSEHQAMPRSGAFTILCALLFPMLDHVYAARLKRLAKNERDDLWSRVFSAFTEAVDRYPVARRAKKVAANLRGETLAALKREAETSIHDRDTRRTLRTIAPLFVNDHEEQIGIAELTPPEAEPLTPEGVAAVERRVDGYMLQGLISESDRALLVGVYAQGRTLADIAKELGISREAAKKRLQRAREHVLVGKPRRPQSTFTK